jgi:heat shock protein HslJ
MGKIMFSDLASSGAGDFISSGGCNYTLGSYYADGSYIQVGIASAWHPTARHCTPDLMKADSKFDAFLSRVNSFEIHDAKLILKAPGRSGVHVFRRFSRASHSV